MAQKVVDIPGIGEVMLAKRHGSRSLRLTIQPDGRIRVGLPYWVPYSAAIKFALTRANWINSHSAQRRLVLSHDDRIGKGYRLEFRLRAPAARAVSTRVDKATITVSSHLNHTDDIVQSAAAAACERALKNESRDILERRLEKLAARYGFTYRALHIKRLTSRWGSCSADDVITLNYFLIQLPWPLIDYVILHELVHTKQRNHSPAFWALLERLLPDAKQLRKEIREHRPALMPQ